MAYAEKTAIEVGTVGVEATDVFEAFVNVFITVTTGPAVQTCCTSCRDVTHCVHITARADVVTVSTPATHRTR